MTNTESQGAGEWIIPGSGADTQGRIVWHVRKDDVLLEFASIDAAIAGKTVLNQQARELSSLRETVCAGRYTVVWTNAAKNVWFTTRVQNVADGAAAVLAVKLDAAGEVTVINVFQGWPAEADDDDDLEGLYDDEDGDALTSPEEVK